MPRIKPETLFSTRNFIILLVDHTKKGEMAGMNLSATMLVNPISNLVREISPKASLDIVNLLTLQKEVSDRSITPYMVGLNAIHAISSATSPTLVVVPGEVMDEENEMIRTYIEFLLMAGGGIVVNVGPNIETKINAALPVIGFDIESQSWSDIELKISTLIRKNIDPATINYYNMMNVLGAKSAHGGDGSICLGDISRIYIDSNTDDNSITSVINVKGRADFAITLSEFCTKIWCNPKLNKEWMIPGRTLIFRDPSLFSKMAAAKVLSQNNAVGKNLKVINL